MRSGSSYRNEIHKIGKGNAGCDEHGLSPGPLNTDKQKNLKEKSVSSKVEKSKEFFKCIGN